MDRYRPVSIVALHQPLPRRVLLYVPASVRNIDNPPHRTEKTEIRSVHLRTSQRKSRDRLEVLAQPQRVPSPTQSRELIFRGVHCAYLAPCGGSVSPGSGPTHQTTNKLRTTEAPVAR
jgi:hypothetical protein